MIERYARPKMKAVWSDENKYDKWYNSLDFCIFPRSVSEYEERSTVPTVIPYQKQMKDYSTFIYNISS